MVPHIDTTVNVRLAHAINVFLFLQGPYNFGKGSEGIGRGKSYRWMANEFLRRIPRTLSRETQGFPSCAHPLTGFAVESLTQPQSSGDWIALKSIPAPGSPLLLQSLTHTTENSFLLSCFQLKWLPTVGCCFMHHKNLNTDNHKKLETTYKTLKWCWRLPMQSFTKKRLLNLLW